MTGFVDSRLGRLFAAAAIPASAWWLAVDSPELRQGILFLAPFLLLLALWRAGVDPTPLLHARPHPRGRVVLRSKLQLRLPHPPERIVSGGLLLASSLAGRGPPRASAVPVC